MNQNDKPGSTPDPNVNTGTGEVTTKAIDVRQLAREFMVGELIACVTKRFQTQDKALREIGA